MKMRQTAICGVFAAVMAFTACPTGDDPTGDITWTAVAVGDPTTTSIDFTFSAAPASLVASDITIADETGSATRDALTGSGTTRTLAVTGVSAGTVTVSINRAGIASGPQTVTLVVPPPAISWSAAAVGSPTTTSIDFTFSAAPPASLAASDITISAGTGSATRGALTGSGTTRTLAVTGVSAGTVTVSINRTGIASWPQTVTLVAPPAITWSAVALGTPTTSIAFTFSADPGPLQAADIISAPGGGSATFVALSGSGTTRSLVVSGVTAGNMSVSVARTGIAADVRTVALIAGAGPNPAYFVVVPGGTFQMGSPAGTPNSNANERPVRAVTVSGFSMSRFQVTQGEWYDIMGMRPSVFNGTNNSSGTATPTFQWRNLPVENVSWYDALVFSNRLSIARGLTPAYSIGGSTDLADWGPVPTGSNATWNAVVIVPGSTGYRLPTEAQWEFAARGGHDSPGNFTFSGSNMATEVAWHSANSGSRTREVGTLAPNALGLYDMSGNVWEWVWDWYGPYPSAAQTDPVGASSGSSRVVRGGGWFESAGAVRSAIRLGDPPSLRSGNLGFRLVRPSLTGQAL